MQKKIGVLLSGLGVGERHAKHIQYNKDTNLLSLFDRDRIKQKRKLTKFKVKGAKSFKEMLLNKDADLVIIASPDHVHCKQIIDSLKKKNMYLQKNQFVTILKNLNK